MSKTRKLLKIGFPFFCLMTGGVLTVQQFSKVKFKYPKVTPLTAEEAEALYGDKQPKQVSIVEEYEKLKQVDLDSWTNIRGPRPYEPDSPELIAQREQLAAKAAARQAAKQQKLTTATTVPVAS